MMRIYRISYEAKNGDGHQGYEYAGSKRTAAKIAKTTETCNATIAPIDIVPTKAGIISALNQYADHAENG